VAQRLHHLGVLEGRLDHQPDAGAGEQQPHRQQHQERHQHHKRTRLGKLRAVQREQRPLQLLGQAVGHRGAAPDQLHDFQDQVRQAERDQQLGHMAELVHPAQGIALKRSAQHKHQQRSQHQRWPEAHHPGDGEREIGTQHVEAGVCEVEHAHHAEDQREAGTQHEKQEPVAHAVQQRDHEKLRIHWNFSSRREKKGPSTSGLEVLTAGNKVPAPAPHQGRFIWHDVGVLAT